MPLVDSLPAALGRIHILGIAGTAMGAFAGMLKDAGYAVTGSDSAVYPPMSGYLASLGIDVKIGYKAENLVPPPDLAVVGNVIRAEYDEAKALLASDIPYTSFPRILGERFLAHSHSIVVAGTHGKTTTTAVTSWLLEAGGLHPGFLIGGVAKNFDRTARAGAGTHFVVEGDEYDTAFFDKRPKFLHYRPRTAIVTSVEFDHGDIYRDLDHVKSAFREFVALVPEDGLLVARHDDDGAREVASGARSEIAWYGPGAAWDGRVEQVDAATGTMAFAVLRDGASIGSFRSVLVGEHNLYNQVASTIVALRQGVSPAAIAQGFSTFSGVKRRQEVIGEPGGVTVIDDFAHHPTAVRVTLEALRERFGGRRMWAVWEPRSATSRRATFQKAYAESFDPADLVVVAAPFDQSRIAESDRFSSVRLVRDLSDRGLDAWVLDGADAIAGHLAAATQPHDVVAILSNGAFDGLHGKLLDLLKARFPGS